MSYIVQVVTHSSTMASILCKVVWTLSQESTLSERCVATLKTQHFDRQKLSIQVPFRNLCRIFVPFLSRLYDNMLTEVWLRCTWVEVMIKTRGRIADGYVCAVGRSACRAKVVLISLLSPWDPEDRWHRSTSCSTVASVRGKWDDPGKHLRNLSLH